MAYEPSHLMILTLPFILILSLWTGYAPASEEVQHGFENPLQPIDTSSPRSTLRGFYEVMEQGYKEAARGLNSYMSSGNLYPTAEELNSYHMSVRLHRLGQKAVDFSELPKATSSHSARLLTLQLKDVLDRVELPPFEEIPDEQAMSREEFKQWSIPGTEIRIVRITSGPRIGEYLFSADTVSHIPEFYDQAYQLPYKDPTRINTFEVANYSPIGVALALQRVVPVKWLLYPPEWSMSRVLDQPLWRWMGILGLLGVIGLMFHVSHRLTLWLIANQGQRYRWAYILRPAALTVSTNLAELIITNVLRVTGNIGNVLAISLSALFYLSLTWLVWVIGSALAESVIRAERLLPDSSDSQLIRLMLRLLTIILAIAILIIGSDRLGLPTYSIMAGLGVGGLAVALAGQQTLANLMGSIIIMIEKPFILGDSIKIKETEGTVESVGFRSTRIRSSYNSIVTIPSSQMVNSIIDNLTRRQQREVKTYLTLQNDTPNYTLMEFVHGIRETLYANHELNKDSIEVYFSGFCPAGLSILVKFMIKTRRQDKEYGVRERIFLEIRHLADLKGVQFALPNVPIPAEFVPGNKPK